MSLPRLKPRRWNRSQKWTCSSSASNSFNSILLALQLWMLGAGFSPLSLASFLHLHVCLNGTATPSGASILSHKANKKTGISRNQLCNLRHKTFPPAYGGKKLCIWQQLFMPSKQEKKGSSAKKAWGGLLADLPRIHSGYSTGAGICSISAH